MASFPPPPAAPPIPARLDWSAIHTVLLDMDGTLLDLHFDNTFFLDVVPRVYGERHGLTPDEARQRVLNAYGVERGTLAWYDLDHWSRILGFDIPILKEEVAHLIQVHPQVIPFLEALAATGRRGHLVTNAHGKSLALKMARTPIGLHLETITSSHDLGLPKEDPAFWEALRQRVVAFDPATTLLVDDSEPVLESAQRYGLGHLLHMAAPSSQLPPRFSTRFPSALSFAEVMPTG